MKQKSLIYAVLVLLVCNAITLIGWSKSMDQVDEYHQYYLGAEELLDTLENQYGWVDAIDNYNYYDAAYKLRNK